jgi:hypothetical protein
MLCKSCGSEIAGNQMYCPHCGTKNELYSNIPASDQAPRQMPNYQMPGQVPPGQMPPGPIPPMMPPYSAMPAGPKKKNPLLPILIAVGAVLFIIIGVIGITKVVGHFSSPEYDTYMFYLNGREQSAVDLNTDIYMENGIAFCLENFHSTDQGDGTKLVEFEIQLGATNENTSVYSDSFLVMPKDGNEVAVSDAVLIGSITDSEGNDLSGSVLLDTEYFYPYKLSFIVPSETRYLTFYGVNYDKGDSAGPAYYSDFYLQ